MGTMWRSPTGCKLDATAAPHGVENASSGSGRDPARAAHGGPVLGLGCGTEFGSIKISGFFFAEGKGKTISEREGKIPPVFLGREGGGNSDKKETAAPAESAFVVYRDGAESAVSGGRGGCSPRGGCQKSAAAALGLLGEAPGGCLN